MSYNYEIQKAELFTDEGQRLLLRIRDNVDRLLEEGGAFRMANAWKGCTADAWKMLACVDRLVELGEIVELSYPSGTPMAQHRVFARLP